MGRNGANMERNRANWTEENGEPGMKSVKNVI